MRRMKLYFFRGSHLPVLMKLVQSTSGPILELGCGVYSTIYLHWACYHTRRRLVTYENNPDYYYFANLGRTRFHEIHCVDKYDDIDVSEPWSIAFVDCSPEEKRNELVRKLTHADYVVLHDAERKNQNKYNYQRIYRLFKNRWRYEGASPHTMVMSNKHDLRGFTLDSAKATNPPEVDSLVPVAEERMYEHHGGPHRRYTICRALRDVFVETKDEEARLKLRYASTLAEYITGRLNEYDAVWLSDFYPRRRDFDRIMRKKR